MRVALRERTRLLRLWLCRSRIVLVFLFLLGGLDAKVAAVIIGTVCCFRCSSLDLLLLDHRNDLLLHADHRGRVGARGVPIEVFAVELVEGLAPLELRHNEPSVPGETCDVQRCG